MELIDEIEELIMMHQEGPYWDFKREWYDDSKDGDLLIDIICIFLNGLRRRTETYRELYHLYILHFA